MNANWIATYRLQLHAGFPLTAAQDVLGYLVDLGISHVYLSPCLQAAPGSQHGYDVTDPTHISEDLGGEEAWSRFVAAARAKGIRILLDIVPNHMATTSSNRWWNDVLENGRYSDFVDFFDIRVADSEPFKVHVCSLGQPYGAALEADELSVDIEAQLPRIKHYDNYWPVSPGSWGMFLEGSAEALPNASCLTHLAELHAVLNPTQQQRTDYQRELQLGKQLMSAARSAGALVKAAARFKDRTQLDALLQRQSYALHGWRLAGELINYRRFFDIGGLSGVRTELKPVFEATHARIAKMTENHEVDGLRVDHPDGLRDPEEYFKWLRALLPEGRIYLEKILENDERLVEHGPLMAPSATISSQRPIAYGWMISAPTC